MSPLSKVDVTGRREYLVEPVMTFMSMVESRPGMPIGALYLDECD